MSRTFRQIPEHWLIALRRLQPVEYGKTPFVQKVSDGKRTFTVEIKRDDRATGLRDHRVHRARARRELRATAGDGLQSGKMRRYGDTYGEYYY